MRRAPKPAEFRRWFDRFLPGLTKGGLGKLSFGQRVVTDRSRPKNRSSGWTESQSCLVHAKHRESALLTMIHREDC